MIVHKSAYLVGWMAVVSALQGCELIGAQGVSASGLFVPDEQTIAQSVAREYGVSPEAVSVSIREVDGGLGSNTSYFTATINGEERNCYITSTVVGIKSSPLCAKPGESISSGDNALTRAARQRN